MAVDAVAVVATIVSTTIVDDGSTPWDVGLAGRDNGPTIAAYAISGSWMQVLAVQEEQVTPEKVARAGRHQKRRDYGNVAISSMGYKPNQLHVNPGIHRPGQ